MTNLKESVFIGWRPNDLPALVLKGIFLLLRIILTLLHFHKSGAIMWVKKGGERVSDSPDWFKDSMLREEQILSKCDGERVIISEREREREREREGERGRQRERGRQGEDQSTKRQKRQTNLSQGRQLLILTTKSVFVCLPMAGMSSRRTVTKGPLRSPEEATFEHGVGENFFECEEECEGGRW
jgi:hypothetical protein